MRVNALNQFFNRLLLALSTGMLVALPTAGMAQTMPHQSPHQSVGTVNCASSTCHGSIAERTATPVLQNEYTTWLREDPHTQAYAVLKNAQSQRIAKNLGLAQPAHEAKTLSSKPGCYIQCNHRRFNQKRSRSAHRIYQTLSVADSLSPTRAHEYPCSEILLEGCLAPIQPVTAPMKTVA